MEMGEKAEVVTAKMVVRRVANFIVALEDIFFDMVEKSEEPKRKIQNPNPKDDVTDFM